MHKIIKMVDGGASSCPAPWRRCEAPRGTRRATCRRTAITIFHSRKTLIKQSTRYLLKVLPLLR